MGDPDVGVDFTLADEVDDFREIGGQGVAGGEDYEFAAVEDNPLFPFPDRLSSVFFALGVKANF